MLKNNVIHNKDSLKYIICLLYQDDLSLTLLILNNLAPCEAICSYNWIYRLKSQQNVLLDSYEYML